MKANSRRSVRALPSLRPGDIVDIVAPAWKCKPTELKAGVRFLRQLGLVPRVPKAIFGKSAMFAQSDEQRFLQLKRALLARDSKAVWCVRGGYGLIRLLPKLSRVKRPKSAKLVIGYSDISTLHMFLNQVWHWPAWHGPLLDRLGRGDHRPGPARELKRMLFGQQTEIEFKGLKPLNKAARSKKVVRGHIVGGNMATLQSSFGTPWKPNARGAIVFFEDIGERPHKVDRMLTQMLQAGYFKHAKAVVFGDMLVANPKDKRMLWQDVLPRFAADVRFPVLYGLPAGHGEIQRTLPFNTPARLHLGRSSARLIVASGLNG